MARILSEQSARTAAGTPKDGVGLLISDGSGGVTGSFTENKDGVVCQYTLTGSYTVNSNGTGTIDVNASLINGMRHDHCGGNFGSV